MIDSEMEWKPIKQNIETIIGNELLQNGDTYFSFPCEMKVLKMFVDHTLKPT